MSRAGSDLDLSDLLPVVGAFGFRVVEAAVERHDDTTTQRLLVQGARPASDDTTERLTDALVAALAGDTTADPLLELVTTTPLDWHRVDWLRAIRHQLRLLGSTWSTAVIDRTLTHNPDAAWALATLFAARLDPAAAAGAEAGAFHALAAIRGAITDLTEDRVVGDLARIVCATLRTNAFAPARDVELDDGRRVSFLACKVDSSRLPGVPEPVPFAEILVTSPLASGVHLRAGRVARGGLRASDRVDVRNEVLDLMAAQVVKNSMIVPTGAKGGFVLHDPPRDPAQRAGAVRDAYSVFVTGLLSVTDDVVDGTVVGPTGVRRRDGDDPYLVVAADKGTARLSDTANAIADRRGFWLGDAFASGGSSGWDHKALGITAKGAWTAIARHFRELGIDVQADPVSVVGIGDMSGDVFGNGLLTSRTLRLQAAFDHRDVFLDPDPDPDASYEERRRLFDLPGSSWQDYDRDVLSRGGLVASRSAKSIELSAPVRDLLATDATSMAPDELVRAILCMKVDLLYAAGIGTVIAASDEDFAGDRGNDDIRVSAARVDARVIGEGANLAITPRGRIEYARRGGRIDQDAIHNAAGVAISDREVNAKILFAPAVDAGKLDRGQRDEVLRSAADEVVVDVCRDVDAQVWMLSRAHATSADDLTAHARHLDRLEGDGVVDRAVDLLPTPDELEARSAAGAGLTRPELATVMAATKRSLADAVLASAVVRAEASRPALLEAFATPIRTHPAVDVGDHRLAAEITALRIASGLVDRVGITHLDEVAADLDRPVADVVAGHWAAQQVLDGDHWWTQLQDLATIVPPETLAAATERLVTLQQDVALALLRGGEVDAARLDDAIARHRPLARAVRRHAAGLGQGPVARDRIALLDDLVGDDLAVDVAADDLLARVPDVAHVLAATTPDRDPPDAGTEEDDVDADVVVALEALSIADERLLVADLTDAVRRTLSDARGGRAEWIRRHGEHLERDLAEVRRRAAAAVVRTGGSGVLVQVVSRESRARVGAALRAVRDDATVAASALAAAVADLRTATDDLPRA